MRARLTAGAVDHSGTPWLARWHLGALPLTVVATALIGTPIVWWLRRHTGMDAGSMTAVMICVAGLIGIAQERPQRLIGGGRLDNRPLLRATIAFLLFGSALHLCRIGFLFPLSAVIVAAVHVHWSGSAAWRGIARLAVAGTVTGQLLVGLRVVDSELPVVPSHVLAAGVLGLSLIAIGNVGLTTERREQAVQALTRAETRFRALVQNSSDVVTVLGRDGRFSYVSPASQAALGHRCADLIGVPSESLVCQRDTARFREHLADLITAAPDAVLRWEARIRFGDGSTGWAEFSGRNLLDDDTVGGLIVHVRDITERRAFADQLAFAASHDPLTGLYNRSAFLTGAADLLAAARPGAAVAVLYCDLDGFKEVNDAYGHSAGDEVLVIAAELLRAELRPGDLLARIGGDEFTAALPGIPDRHAAVATTDRLRRAFALPVRLRDGPSVRVGISIGMVVVERDDAVVKDVLRAADQAMYQWKSRARDRFGLPSAS